MRNLFLPLKNSLYMAAYQMGLLPFFSRGREATGTHILMYHRVNNKNDAYLPALPVKQFEQQMAYLARHFHVISLDAFSQHYREGTLSSDMVVITFDDGYRDTYTDAFPVLTRLGLPATVFLATGCIDRQCFLWTDLVSLFFKGTDQKKLVIQYPHRQSFSIAERDERLVALRQVKRMMKGMPSFERDKMIDDLAGMLRVSKEMDPNEMLTWEEVRKMHECGISFGGHTVTHPILTQIPLSVAKEEIAGCKARIEGVLSSPVTTFAYPNGEAEDFNHDIEKIVSECGFVCAVSTLEGVNHPGVPPFALRRTPTTTPTVAHFTRIVPSH